MKFIIGKKIEMTQIWQGDKVIAVTKVAAGPCTVTQIKTQEKDGYESVQLGFGERKEKNIKKPQKGHLAKLKVKNEILKTNLRHLREFRSLPEAIDLGDQVNVDTFQEGDIVNVTSNSKGKGFQGVVKRHGFSGSKMTHGNKDQQRMSGSVGATGPAHVFKGTRMGGRTGGNQVTTTNVEIIKVDSENNILYIKGSVPGARNGVVLVAGKGDLKFAKLEKPVEVVEEIQKEIKSEEPKAKEEENIEAVVEEAAVKIKEENKSTLDQDKKEEKPTEDGLKK